MNMALIIYLAIQVEQSYLSMIKFQKKKILNIFELDMNKVPVMLQKVMQDHQANLELH